MFGAVGAYCSVFFKPSPVVCNKAIFLTCAVVSLVPAPRRKGALTGGMVRVLSTFRLEWEQCCRCGHLREEKWNVNTQ